MNPKKRILICPLDWGLGHATRCIPIIRQLLHQGAEVLIAASGRPLELLKTEFPDLEFILFEGVEIKYPAGKNLPLNLILQVPGFIKGIYREHQKLKKIIITYQIDAVISDNRYGLYSNKVPCIFITHQLYIKCPPALYFLESLTFSINSFFIKKYTQCWIPDFQGDDNLSGELSHKYKPPFPVHFIGPLSRFSSIANGTPKKEKEYDLIVLLSGPEPQRTFFEASILNQLENMSLKTLVVRGIPESGKESSRLKNTFIENHLNAFDLQEAISKSECVLSRPGYSTIMDLAVLGGKAVFVPTPGQTEQEYLATYCASKNTFGFQKQENFNLKKLLEDNSKLLGITLKHSSDILSQTVAGFLKRLIDA